MFKTSTIWNTGTRLAPVCTALQSPCGASGSAGHKDYSSTPVCPYTFPVIKGAQTNRLHLSPIETPTACCTNTPVPC
jgi:hypothetical protein